MKALMSVMCAAVGLTALSTISVAQAPDKNKNPAARPAPTAARTAPPRAAAPAAPRQAARPPAPRPVSRRPAATVQRAQPQRPATIQRAPQQRAVVRNRIVEQKGARERAQQQVQERQQQLRRQALPQLWSHDSGNRAASNKTRGVLRTVPKGAEPASLVSWHALLLRGSAAERAGRIHTRDQC